MFEVSVLLRYTKIKQIPVVNLGSAIYEYLK